MQLLLLSFLNPLWEFLKVYNSIFLLPYLREKFCYWIIELLNITTWNFAKIFKISQVTCSKKEWSGLKLDYVTHNICISFFAKKIYVSKLCNQNVSSSTTQVLANTKFQNNYYRVDCIKKLDHCKKKLKKLWIVPALAMILPNSIKDFFLCSLCILYF